LEGAGRLDVIEKVDQGISQEERKYDEAQDGALAADCLNTTRDDDPLAPIRRELHQWSQDLLESSSSSGEQEPSSMLLDPKADATALAERVRAMRKDSQDRLAQKQETIDSLRLQIIRTAEEEKKNASPLSSTTEETLNLL
jgi:hypothetical protein